MRVILRHEQVTLRAGILEDDRVQRTPNLLAMKGTLLNFIGKIVQRKPHSSSQVFACVEAKS